MQFEQIDFERVTAGLKTKSDKIRALSRSGAPTAEIARFLDIRYQHARNVLVEAGLYRRTSDDRASSDGVDVPVETAWVEMDTTGKVTLPSELADLAGLIPGRLFVRLTDNGLEVLSRKAALAEAQARLAPYVQSGRSIVDEFIADRHREAEHE